MSDDLHDSTLILEFFELVLFNNLSFYLFNGDSSMFPSAAIDDTVPALRKFSIKLQVRIVDLIVGFEALGAGEAIWVHQHGLLALDGLPDLFFDILSVGTSLLQFCDERTDLGLQHPDSSSLVLI